jgi:hypothetical protein
MATVRKKGVKNKRPLKRQKKTYELPAKKSIPSDSLQDYSILIYGKKKIGKSTLASQFENTIFLMCEPGGKALSVYQVSVKNWQDFEGYIDLAIKDKRFRTIVIDTSDYAYEYCLEYVCEKLVIDHPSDEAYGKGWKAVRKEFTRVINKLLHSGKGVIFISHSKDEEIKTRRNSSYHKVTSSMPGQARDVLEGLIDIWVNYDYDGKRRYLIIQGNDEIDAGHRLKNHFQYSDGQRIEKINMGTNETQAYKNFIAAFNNHVEKGEKTKKKKLVLKKKTRRK